MSIQQKDIRETELYREAAALYTGVRQPGTGQISDIAAVHASPDGNRAVFAGTMVDKFENAPLSRICEVELATGNMRVLTFGPTTDRSPQYSPDGRHIAFLSDRTKNDQFQLYLLDPAMGAARYTAGGGMGRVPALVSGWQMHLTRRCRARCR